MYFFEIEIKRLFLFKIYLFDCVLIFRLFLDEVVIEYYDLVVFECVEQVDELI